MFYLTFSLLIALNTICESLSFESFKQSEYDWQGLVDGVDNEWLSPAKSNYALNEKCRNDLHTWFSSLNNATIAENRWALQMVDAFGKPPSGILDGNIHWPGNYFECLLVKPKGHNFSGQYCTAKWPLSSIVGQASDTRQNQYSMGTDLSIGVCVPDSCTEQDLLGYVSDGLNTIKGLPYVSQILEKLTVNASITCAVSPPMDASSIVCLVVIIIILFLVVVSTLGDLYLENRIIINKVHIEEVSTINENGIEIHSLRTDIDENDSAKNQIMSNTNKEVESTDQSRLTNLRQMNDYAKIFSLKSNAIKLFTTNTKGDLACVHGVRFLSMQWIIIGHTYVFSMTVIGNVLKAIKDVDNLPFYIIMNGSFAVDTFFVLSGFLVAYLFYREMEAGTKFNLVKYYFWRFWRLTPVYALVLWFNSSLAGHLGSGPYWDYQAQEKELCSKTWWANLLYINNFKGGITGCMTWSWYLANDMQFYLISPMFLFLFKRHPRYAVYASGATITASWLLSGILSYKIGYLGRPASGENFLGDNSTEYKLRKHDEFMADIYNKPYCRIQPYLLGLVAGYILHKYSSECRMLSKSKMYFGTIVASACSLFAIYCTYHANMTVVQTAFETAFLRTLWAVGICWLLVTCLTGHLTIVNSILSWTFWVPLSRATYCAYLIHPVVLLVYYKNYDMPFMFSHSKVMALAAGMTIYIYITSILVSLFVEAPLVQLGKHVFDKRK